MQSLRANIEWKSPFLKLGGSLWPKISHRRGHLPPTISAQMDRLVNALQLWHWQFSHKQTLQHTFFQRGPFLIRNDKIVAFEAPFGGLRATYDVHLRLIGKLVGDFLLVIIETFFARCFRFVTIHAFDRRTDGRTDRQNLDSNTVRICFA